MDQELTDELDVYRAAKLTIDQHGEDAADFAIKRSEQLFDAGEREGAATWRLILAAVVELLREPGSTTY